MIRGLISLFLIMNFCLNIFGMQHCYYYTILLHLHSHFVCLANIFDHCISIGFLQVAIIFGDFQGILNGTLFLLWKYILFILSFLFLLLSHLIIFLRISYFVIVTFLCCVVTAFSFQLMCFCTAWPRDWIHNFRKNETNIFFFSSSASINILWYKLNNQIIEHQNVVIEITKNEDISFKVLGNDHIGFILLQLGN